CGRERFEDAADAFGVFSVGLEMSGNNLHRRATLQGLRDGHTGCDAEQFCLIACRNNPFTADRYRPAAKPTLQRLLDRREKAVHVHANDMRGGKAPYAYRLGFFW